jgi:hypothetical protein
MMSGITKFNVRGINFKLFSEIRKFSLLSTRVYSRLAIGYNHDNLTVPQLKLKLARLNTLELRKLRNDELANKRRRMYLFAITNELNEKTAEKTSSS